MRKTNRDINPSKLSILTNNIQECDLCDLLHDGITLIGNNRYKFNQQGDFLKKRLVYLVCLNRIISTIQRLSINSTAKDRFLILSAVLKNMAGRWGIPKLAMEVQLAGKIIELNEICHV